MTEWVITLTDLRYVVLYASPGGSEHKLRSDADTVPEGGRRLSLMRGQLSWEVDRAASNRSLAPLSGRFARVQAEQRWPRDKRCAVILIIPLKLLGSPWRRVSLHISSSVQFLLEEIVVVRLSGFLEPSVPPRRLLVVAHPYRQADRVPRVSAVDTKLLAALANQRTLANGLLLVLVEKVVGRLRGGGVHVLRVQRVQHSWGQGEKYGLELPRLPDHIVDQYAGRCPRGDPRLVVQQEPIGQVVPVRGLGRIYSEVQQVIAYRIQLALLSDAAAVLPVVLLLLRTLHYDHRTIAHGQVQPLSHVREKPKHAHRHHICMPFHRF